MVHHTWATAPTDTARLAAVPVPEEVAGGLVQEAPLRVGAILTLVLRRAWVVLPME